MKYIYVYILGSDFNKMISYRPLYRSEVGCIDRKPRANTADIGSATRAIRKVRKKSLHRAIKEETIAKNCVWVYNKACRLSHYVHVVPHFSITFNYIFKLIFQHFF